MTWSSYSSYLLIVVLIVLAPGPDTMVMLKNSLSGGSHGGFLATAGIFVGNVVQGTAAALGLGVVIAQSQPVFVTLKWLGAAYLVFLGFQALRGAWRGDYSGVEAVKHQRAGGFRRFREGFVSNITNPKVLVLYLSVLPQFLDPATTSAWHALLLAYTVAVLGFIWLMVLLFFVHRVRTWLERRKVRRALDGVTGTALVGFGAALVFE
ncbi:LysE family translocator [Amycolatopsis regifaucium]|uniref:Lysine transporter LysE n=1 Tax=Amycolatopsis regifaucium TaxID=546365 RepID=A0A154MHI8_9PSEU|nr:LysE family translocator [Amycolatopsis regifaucium]KZB83872.1 lysine transporter LysE [Amycolatopsis regifaucium]OKA06684.1 lysine transporter LysE [Amycolatopsis regifaucium]SFH23878.1 resistance to homoserine/threonine (RhtB) family protein [Amycolatopsis regifaucium]